MVRDRIDQKRRTIGCVDACVHENNRSKMKTFVVHFRLISALIWHTTGLSDFVRLNVRGCFRENLHVTSMPLESHLFTGIFQGLVLTVTYSPLIYTEFQQLLTIGNTAYDRGATSVSNLVVCNTEPSSPEPVNSDHTIQRIWKHWQCTSFGWFYLVHSETK